MKKSVKTKTGAKKAPKAKAKETPRPDRPAIPQRPEGLRKSTGGSFDDD